MGKEELEMWKVKAKVVPIVIGILYTMTSKLEKRL